MKNALKELGDVACEHGVALALEPMHAGCAPDWTFLTSLDETLDLVQAVDCPQLKLAFDLYHMGHDARVLERLPSWFPGSPSCS